LTFAQQANERRMSRNPLELQISMRESRSVCWAKGIHYEVMEG
jgi:hypothetical protein